MADIPDLIGQDEIERLLSSSMAGSSGPALASTPPPSVQSPAASDPPGAAPPKRDPPSQFTADPRSPTATTPAGIAQSDMEVLLQQAEKALASIEEGPPQDVPPGMAPFHWEELSVVPANAESATLDLIRDVELDVSIELGRTRMYLEDVLKLRRGAVVTLDKLAGDPVDVYVNGRLVARGEVLVLNDNFCVRVAELVAGVNSP